MTQTGSARYAYTLKIDVTAADAKSAVEARYGATALVWRPEAGFAILGLAAGSGVRALSLSGEAELNADQFALPEDATVSAGGNKVWSGGNKVWSGSNGAWTGSAGTLMASSLNAAAWSQIKLAGARLAAPKLGAGVKVAVIDTGLDLAHPAFRGHLAPQSDWKDFVNGDANPQEVSASSGSNAGYGHGTGVGGVILQIAPQAVLMPLRVLGPDGSGDVSDVAAAMDWAIAHGARIINLSLGSAKASSAVDAMISYAAQKNVYVVASSGNSGNQNVTHPAFEGNAAGFDGLFVLSVGSVNASDVKSPFSTYGPSLDLTAPGENIYTAVPNSQIGHWSGTSFAAPMVAGALALELGEGARGIQTPLALPGLLLNGTDDISAGNAAYQTALGEGRLNIAGFLSKAIVR